MAEQRRALIVDDDAPIRSMLAKVIGRKDLKIDTARDGAEAIERIDGGRYDVILLDLMMPRVDGFAVLEHLRRTQPQKLRQTIVASAVPEAEIRRQVPTQVYGVHAKPFDIGTLRTDIDECIANGAVYSQNSRQTGSAIGKLRPAGT